MGVIDCICTGVIDCICTGVIEYDIYGVIDWWASVYVGRVRREQEHKGVLAPNPNNPIYNRVEYVCQILVLFGRLTALYQALRRL